MNNLSDRITDDNNWEYYQHCEIDGWLVFIDQVQEFDPEKQTTPTNNNQNNNPTNTDQVLIDTCKVNNQGNVQARGRYTADGDYVLVTLIKTA